MTFCLPHTTPARVTNYLTGGKDHFAADRRIAEAVLEAHPDQADLITAAALAVAEYTEACATDGLDQYLVLGCGLPRPDAAPVHRVAQDASPEAHVLYLDSDIQAVVTTRAHYHHVAHVSVLDTDLTTPVPTEPALRSALDLGRPVVVVADLVLQHLTDADLTDLARHLAAELAPGSRLVLTHPTGPGSEAAGQAYTETALAEAVHTRYLARDKAHLDQCLPGWSLDSTNETEHGLLSVVARLP